MDNVKSDDTLTAKRQLVVDLKAMLAHKLENGEALESKAIELFKFSSATLGLAAGLGINRTSIHGDNLVSIGYGLLLVTYICHALFLYRVLKPSVYSDCTRYT